ncbi:MAG: hypothetical protein PHE33_06100 [Bacteroidales bacterium]|nr:hypothetical protein [Bacteroidales bacterium]
MKNKTIFVLILYVGFSLNSIGQIDTVPKETRTKLIDISAGLATGNLRDMGTSPLFYTGLLPVVDITYSDFYNNNLIQFNIISYNGIYIKLTDDDSYTSTANSVNTEIAYYRHYQDYDDTGFKHYPGASINNYTSIRVNSAFNNAAFTFDNISSLNLNYFITKEFTLKAKQKKFLWLIKYYREEKQYLASFKIGVPIYSLIYRPGFTNPGNSTLNNSFLLPDYKITGKVFSGMNTNLSLSKILPNGNMIKLTYHWEYFTSGRYSLNRLDMSKHALLFSLVFKMN